MFCTVCSLQLGVEGEVQTAAGKLMELCTVSQVILDKNPQLRTIVNKVGSIENEFRVFQMECIAGKPEYVTDVVQHGVRFRLNFSEVSPAYHPLCASRW